MSRSENNPPDQLPDWDLYHALREQWTHNLVNHRLMGLVLSQGLLWMLAATGFIQSN